MFSLAELHLPPPHLYSKWLLSHFHTLLLGYFFHTVPTNQQINTKMPILWLQKPVWAASYWTKSLAFSKLLPGISLLTAVEHFAEESRQKLGKQHFKAHLRSTLKYKVWKIQLKFILLNLQDAYQWFLIPSSHTHNTAPDASHNAMTWDFFSSTYTTKMIRQNSTEKCEKLSTG